MAYEGATTEPAAYVCSQSGAARVCEPHSIGADASLVFDSECEGPGAALAALGCPIAKARGAISRVAANIDGARSVRVADATD